MDNPSIVSNSSFHQQLKNYFASPEVKLHASPAEISRMRAIAKDYLHALNQGKEITNQPHQFAIVNEKNLIFLTATCEAIFNSIHKSPEELLATWTTNANHGDWTRNQAILRALIQTKDRWGDKQLYQFLQAASISKTGGTWFIDKETPSKLQNLLCEQRKYSTIEAFYNAQAASEPHQAALSPLMAMLKSEQKKLDSLNEAEVSWESCLKDAFSTGHYGTSDLFKQMAFQREAPSCPLELRTPKSMELPPLLVELGFGTGRDTRDLLNLEWQVTTVDPSETAEALCRDQYDYELESNMLSFKKATIEEFEFPNDVGVIFSNDTLPYCAPEKFPAALKKMHEALASGGKLMGNFFGEGENPESATAKRAMYKAFFIATGDGQSKRTKDQIIQDEKATVNQLLCDAGFQDVKIFHTTNRDNLSSIRFVATKSS